MGNHSPTYMEEQYLRLLRKTLTEGVRVKNRTGIDTYRIEGDMLQLDMSSGYFPAITTKKLAFKSVVGELIGFMHGFTSASEFREVGCKIWDQNANENRQWLVNPNRVGYDDLGRIYGYQWRYWQTDSRKHESYDQLKVAVQKIVSTPEDRRIIVSAWNPSDLDKMALPPCHVMHQYICDPETKELSLCMYQRSCDMFLGVPFNMASYALLLSLVAHVTGYMPKKLTMFLADVHIYSNHVAQVEEQLRREVYIPPKLKLTNPDEGEGVDPDNPFDARDPEPFGKLLRFRPEHIQLEKYMHHLAIPAPMAV